MKTWPLKFREITPGELLFSDDAGGYFRSDAQFLERYAEGQLTFADQKFLLSNGHAFRDEDDLQFTAFAYRWAARHFAPSHMNYIILVPTLRCNLSCDYCQVSRVNETARGFDWDEETLDAVLVFLDQLTTDEIKIEFQGGEPLLRLDLLGKVRDFCRDRFREVQFVVCTNLQSLSQAEWEFLSAKDTFISTSFDGTISLHQKHRTKTSAATSIFLNNLKNALERFGAEKVSALPTLDPDHLPDPEEVIENFVGLGLRSIYLRPINHQGFARKRFAGTPADQWDQFRSDFVDKLVEHNAGSDDPVEEYYFTHCLRRVFRLKQNNHADLRNPNVLGLDYLVIDYDGVVYPTDEARMLTRIGQIDLSIGDIFKGVDEKKLAILNENSANDFDPDCIHCVYQPFCGVDVIDDISRYGRTDLPRHMTDFCRRHMAIFDKIFSMIYSDDPKVRESLSIWLGTNSFDAKLASVHQ